MQKEYGNQLPTLRRIEREKPSTATKMVNKQRRLSSRI